MPHASAPGRLTEWTISAAAALVVAALAAVVLGLANWSGIQLAPSASSSGAQSAVEGDYGRLPLAFEPAAPSVGHGVDYVAKGPGYSAFLAGETTTLALDPKGGEVLALEIGLKGAAPEAAVGEARLPGESNYFVGPRSEWRSGVPTFERVRYPEAWPGIDVLHYGNQGRLQYDFHVAPGADPSRIGLSFAGQHDLRVAANGDLVLAVPGRDLRQQAPFAYQTAGGERTAVESSYAIRGDGTVGIELGRYDRTRPLVIDPVVLTYSTFLGGAASDTGRRLVVDGSGAVYLAGDTLSADFPTTPGAYDTTHNGNGDVFVAKLNPAGSALEYATVIGGGNGEFGLAMAVDGTGVVYVGGQAESGFPTTPGAFDTSQNGGDDAFAAKLSADGSSLLYSTYLGASAFDQVWGMAIDATGAAYLAIRTQSTGFPTTAGAFDTTANGGTDGVVAKLNPSGSALEYSTFLGGTASDFPRNVAVDAGGSAYVAGQTSSAGFPTTPGAFDTSPAGTDAFVTKVNAAGSALEASTVFGGTSGEDPLGFTRDASGAVYLTGSTSSDDLPTSSDAFDASHNGPPPVPPLNIRGQDAFAAKLNPSLTTLEYSTYLGGGATDRAEEIAVDDAGVATVAGTTTSPNFPTTTDAVDASHNGSNDLFVTRLNTDASALGFSTFLGGTGSEMPSGAPLGLGVDDSGATYVGGHTTSSDFPTTTGALDESYNGVRDAFIVKLTDVPDADLALTKTDSPDPANVGEDVTYELTVENHGPEAAPDVQIIDALPASATFISASPGCGFAAGTVTCDLGTLPAGGPPQTVEIVVRPTEAGTITNNANVSHSGADPDSSNDGASEQTTVRQSDLALSKFDSPDPATVGEELTYTLTVDNDGPTLADAVTVEDTLPAGVEFVDTSAECSHSLGTVSCDLGTIANSQTKSVFITVRPTAPGTLSNTATVSSQTTDPDSENDTATELTTVDDAPPPTPDEADLTLSKADSPDPAFVGEDLVYTLRVDNNGPDDAEAVAVSDTLPPSVTFNSASAGCAEAAGIVSCDFGSIASGTTKSAEVRVTPETAGTILNAASVSSATDDPESSNDSAVEETIVQESEGPGPPGPPDGPAGCGEPTITGTPGSETLQGTSGADVIRGKAGNDRVRAGGGKDIVCGGPGKDRISGGGGRDRLLGNAGRDLLRGQGGRDTLRGGSGGDRLRGGGGADFCRGGPGVDRRTGC